MKNLFTLLFLTAAFSAFAQKEIVDLIVKKSNNVYKSGDIFANSWLDVEDIYRNAGWDVEYDKPGYCENYEAHFVFRKKK